MTYTPTRMINSCPDCNCDDCNNQRATQSSMTDYDTPVFKELSRTHTKENGTHIFLRINYMEIVQFYGVEALQDISTVQQWYKDMDDPESILYKERQKRVNLYNTTIQEGFGGVFLPPDEFAKRNKMLEINK